MADRFYCPSPWASGRATLQGDEARHLARVRRVAPGELVTLFDGAGRSAEARVEEIGRDVVALTIVSERADDRRLAGPLVLATAVPKGDRFDWLVEKATELGVSRLVPLITERSSVDPRATKLDRLRRLVVEASKQSGRAQLLAIDAPTPWADWLRLDRAGAATRYVADPAGSPLNGRPRPNLRAGITVAVGPEGGFTDAEQRAAREAGYARIGLGPTVLRVETAALVACAGVLAWSIETDDHDLETGRGKPE